MLTIYYINSLDVQKEIALDLLLGYLPMSFKERALRYRSKQDAYNFVIGRLFLKKALQESNLPLGGLETIYYNEEEKPLMEGLSFSISHSNDLVACAFASGGNIGLDVEFPRAINRKHFRHCFNEKEWRKIQEDTTMHTFYTYWTQKEAILKANGLGLGHLLDIQIESDVLAYMNNSSTNWHLKSIRFEGEEAYGCLCTDLVGEITTQKMELEELLF
ncbi:4'-phosphopantetheinyl transferase family protein [Aureispira anguillae]|uniref:4'-phosphopantetheinyl transferase superfamily protein n=1 Tax=Aureispira anguillae TaxID=2864201 RepID=A0A916DSE7_9BACT|nr:4'-phosphopantetheinyl transferase superfamily protein [Aureispira anguillae]BDS11140.1 4'-phosphopantetheinyl transferase superfamily protein [Aureispira anguillae]